MRHDAGPPHGVGDYVGNMQSGVPHGQVRRKHNNKETLNVMSARDLCWYPLLCPGLNLFFVSLGKMCAHYTLNFDAYRRVEPL